MNQEIIKSLQTVEETIDVLIYSIACNQDLSEEHKKESIDQLKFMANERDRLFEKL